MKITHILLILLFAGAWGSCKKFDGDINTNPNLPATATNAQLLTYAIQRAVETIEPLAGTGSPNGVLYSQQIAEKIYTDASRYTVVSFDFYSFYTNGLMNLQSILDTKEFKVEDGSQNNQLAVARILRAHYYWHITDRWGDVPYSDALKGKENFTPAYDKQQDIYNDLFKELKEAAAQIDDGPGVKGDLLFDGDMPKWKRLANSMRMLMALRLSKADPAKGKQEFQDAYNAGGFTGNEDNVVYKHLTEAANESYWYNVFSVLNREWYCISEPLVKFMGPLKDPRLKTFADTTIKTGGYIGMPYGVTGDDAQLFPADSVSFLGEKLRAQDAPTYLMTYAQLLLAQAEAAKRGWINGDDEKAKELYNTAIEASVLQWNGGDAGLSDYMKQAAVKYNPADAIKQIAYQRWVHLYLNGYEAWAEWRRTGYPVLQPAPDNGNIPIPRRQGYPLAENSINTANYKAAVQAQSGFNGKDDLNGRVWWDK